MNGGIRILEIINEAVIGGGQAHVLQLASGLDKRRFDVRVACADNGPLVEGLRSRGIAVSTIALAHRIDLAALRELVHLLQEQNIDIVHVHGGVAGLWGRLAAFMAKTPIRIYTLHGIHYLHYKNPVKRALFIALERMLSHWTQRIICVSAADLQSGVRAGCFAQKRAMLIRNGIAAPVLPAAFEAQAKKKELGIPDQVHVIGSVGRLHYQKGQCYLLEAARLLLQKIPDLRVLLAGDGPLRDELEALAQQLGISDKVIFAGARRDVPELLAIMDVFVLSSRWEGLPLSLLEAMAMAKPIACFAVAGIEELLEDGRSGLLTPPGDADALAAAIGRLLQDQESAKQMAVCGKATFQEHFEKQGMLQATASLYEELFASYRS